MKRHFIFLALFVSLSLTGTLVFAQEAGQITYPEGFATDMDLDGLTDEGEKNIYFTDPRNSDTDADGYFDGVEILNGTDPLDAQSSINPEPVTGIDMEPSWPWYITRVTALVSFALLYVAIFLGLTVRLPFLNKIFSPLTSLKVHAWISVQSLILAVAHGASLMFDKFLKFTLAEVFVPFASSFETNFVALGTIGFYIMILLILTSYFRHLMSHRIWRITHFLNIILYVIVIIHATSLGTDIKNYGIVRDVFIVANAFLIPLFFLNFSYQLFMAIKRKVTLWKIKRA